MMADMAESGLGAALSHFHCAFGTRYRAVRQHPGSVRALGESARAFGTLSRSVHSGYSSEASKMLRFGRISSTERDICPSVCTRPRIGLRGQKESTAPFVNRCLHAKGVPRQAVPFDSITLMPFRVVPPGTLYPALPRVLGYTGPPLRRCSDLRPPFAPPSRGA